MSIGALNRRVSIQKETRTADGAGGFTRTWATIAVVWGKLTPKSGGESLDAQQQTNEQRFVLKIRHRTDVSTAKRVLISGDAYNITNAFNIDQKRRYLTATVVAGVAT